MPKYTVDYLYNEFSGLAGMRTGSEYASDAGYWTGGRCDWGGSHNLREDCGTIAKGFEKLESLDGEAIKAELNKCTSQGEYESKKSDYIRKANEISSGLQARTGYSSSMFGICIIWADQAMSPYIENKMQDGRRMLEQLKSDLGQGKYQHVEELKRLKLEQKQIEDRMKENKRKAAKSKDPAERAALLLLIEEDGKRLEKNLSQQNAIPTFKIKFDASKYVSEMIEGMKKAIEKNNRGGSGGGGGGGNPNKPKKPNGDPDDPFGDGNGGGSNGDGTLPNNNPRSPRKRNQPEQNNQQMLMIGIAALVIIFLLMSQKDTDRPRSRYDDYDY